MLLETDGEGTTQVAYTQTPELYGALVSQRRGETTSFYHFDALGSTTELTDADEAATDSYRYYAFGETLTSAGSTPNAFGFVGNLGYYSEPALSLQYLRARWYQPGTGRFISRDPAPSVSSPYRYGAGNVVNRVDPSGQLCTPWVTQNYFPGTWALDQQVRPNPSITYLPDRIRTTWHWEKTDWWYKKRWCYKRGECGDLHWIDEYTWVAREKQAATTDTIYHPTDSCMTALQMYARRTAGEDHTKYLGFCYSCCEERYQYWGAETVQKCYDSCFGAGLPVPGVPLPTR